MRRICDPGTLMAIKMRGKGWLWWVQVEESRFQPSALFYSLSLTHTENRLRQAERGGLPARDMCVYACVCECVFWGVAKKPVRSLVRAEEWTRAAPPPQPNEAPVNRRVWLALVWLSPLQWRTGWVGSLSLLIRQPPWCARLHLHLLTLLRHRL